MTENQEQTEALSRIVMAFPEFVFYKGSDYSRWLKASTAGKADDIVMVIARDSETGEMFFSSPKKVGSIPSESVSRGPVATARDIFRPKTESERLEVRTQIFGWAILAAPMYIYGVVHNMAKHHRFYTPSEHTRAVEDAISRTIRESQEHNFKKSMSEENNEDSE